MSQQVIMQNGGKNAVGERFTHLAPKITLSAMGVFSDATKLYFEAWCGCEWSRLHDTDGSEIELREEFVDYHIDWLPVEYDIRAVIVGGDGNTDVTVTMTS